MIRKLITTAATLLSVAGYALTMTPTQPLEPDTYYLQVEGAEPADEFHLHVEDAEGNTKLDTPVKMGPKGYLTPSDSDGHIGLRISDWPDDTYLDLTLIAKDGSEANSQINNG